MKAAAILVGALIALWLAAPAAAEWSAPQMISSSPREQADGVASSELSADGRYLVFAGSLDGIAGILRLDPQSGAVEPVAAGDAYGDDPVVGSRNPSISANGRYVAFTSDAALVPADDHDQTADVYVRDMELSAPPGGEPCDIEGPCAYTLASALDGTGEGISGISAAAPRSAISSDGRRVAFAVQSESDLAGPGTPAGQVAVRDLDTDQTTLVSSELDPLTGAMTGRPVEGGAITTGYPAISADGTTVAWDGIEIARQAPTITGDPARVEGYNEPLWRRVAGGASAPTRRVAGAADPGAPGCPPAGSFAEPACQGPYPDLGQNFGDQGPGGWLAEPTPETATPAISADGSEVAFLGGPPNPASPEEERLVNRKLDVFVVDMTAGLPERAAVRRLTDAHGARGPSPKATSLAISPDGLQVAFTAARVEFPLTPPFLTGEMPSQVGLAEIYVIDLRDDSLRWLSQTPGGGPSSLAPGIGISGVAGAASPSFGSDGVLLAFDSSASNLVAVDRNGSDDAFLVRDLTVPAGRPGHSQISPQPAPKQIHRAWRFALRAVSLPDGKVRFIADCPAAGRLRASVVAAVPSWRRIEVRSPGGRRHRSRRRVLVKARVAGAAVKVRRDGITRVEARPSGPYRRLARGKGGLEGTATVSFAAPGHATLHESLSVRFAQKSAKPGAR